MGFNVSEKAVDIITVGVDVGQVSHLKSEPKLKTGKTTAHIKIAREHKIDSIMIITSNCLISWLLFTIFSICLMFYMPVSASEVKPYELTLTAPITTWVVIAD